MTKLTLVHAESNYVPGRLTSACSTPAAVNERAAAMLNMLLDEMDMKEDATPDNWQEKRLEFRAACAGKLGVDVDKLADNDCGDVWTEEVTVYGDTIEFGSK